MLAAEDREAITKYVTSEAARGVSALDIPTAYQVTRDAQLIYLEQLLKDFEKHLGESHDENWWQTYFGKNILFFQNSYITRLEKLNVAVAATQFPDFIVATSDSYLDIIEIKKPATDREDTSRHNFYWSPEIAKGIAQVENYIDKVTKHADSIRSKLRDDYRLDLRVIKPRGLIIAGRSMEFAGKPKMADDFRLLNESLKNTQIVPFDELASRLRNTILSINQLATAKKPKT